MQNFPKISRADKIIGCFNCYQDLYGVDFFESENPQGKGKYYACCDSCSMKTFFDFVEGDHATDTN